MPAARANFELFRGETRPLVFGPLVDASGAIQDVAGYSGVLAIRPTTASPDPPTLEITTSPGDPTTDGLLIGRLTQAQGLSLAAGRYAYTHEVTSSDGDVVVTTRGVVTVLNDLVNPPA